MPRPKLSPLSSLLPIKGAATRPEPLQPASDHESKQARELSSMQESMPARSEEVRSYASDNANKHEQERLPASNRTRMPAKGHKDGPRSAVSFRMTEGLQERLRLYAFETRRSKQDILDDALHEYLLREGH